MKKSLKKLLHFLLTLIVLCAIMCANGGDIMAAKKRDVDMLNGPLFKSIIRFSVPVMLSNLLGVFYHAADVIVVGKFGSSDALAGVGASGPIVGLLTALFTGLSVGVQVVVAKSLGVGDKKRTEKLVHTSMLLSLICGAIITIVGLAITDSLLLGMNVPEDGNVFIQAKIYLQITFLSRFPTMIYNFGSGIVSAKGDSKTPMYIIMVSGAVNVILNLIFVIAFGMEAAGVALATLISLIVCAVWILVVLFRAEEPTRLFLKKLKMHKDCLFEIIKVGVPSGLQNISFQLPNVIVQSSINSFGGAYIAGDTAASSVGNLFYAVISMFLTACAVFTSQNYGAKNYKRVSKTVLYCLLSTGALWIVDVLAVFLLGKPMLGLYASTDASAIEQAEIISHGFVRLIWVVGFYGVNMISEIFATTLRSMGYPMRSLLSSLIGVCVVRIIWIYTAFRYLGTFESIYMCFPISWACSLVLSGVMLLMARRKLVKSSDALLA